MVFLIIYKLPGYQSVVISEVYWYSSVVTMIKQHLQACKNTVQQVLEHPHKFTSTYVITLKVMWLYYDA